MSTAPSPSSDTEPSVARDPVVIRGAGAPRRSPSMTSTWSPTKSNVADRADLDAGDAHRRARLQARRCCRTSSSASSAARRSRPRRSSRKIRNVARADGDDRRRCRSSVPTRRASACAAWSPPYDRNAFRYGSLRLPQLGGVAFEVRCAPSFSMMNSASSAFFSSAGTMLNAAVLAHRLVGGDAERVAQLVRDDDRADVLEIAQLDDLVVDGVGGDRIEPGRRLVVEQDARLEATSRARWPRAGAARPTAPTASCRCAR